MTMALNNLSIVPGKSLGEVRIGQSKVELIQQNFKLEENRDPKVYFKKNNLLVRLEDEKVVQIWFEGQNLSELFFKDKSMPRKSDPQTLKKIFNCEPKIEGTGGYLFFCENHGLELDYSPKHELVGFSVIAPKVADSIVAPSSK